MSLRNEQIQKLESEAFEVLIIGGGINGSVQLPHCHQEESKPLSSTAKILEAKPAKVLRT